MYTNRREPKVIQPVKREHYQMVGGGESQSTAVDDSSEVII